MACRAAVRSCGSAAARTARPQRRVPRRPASCAPRRRAAAAHCDAHLRGPVGRRRDGFDASGAASTKNDDRYAGHLRREGCVGVFVCGTSGESMSLSVGERERLAEAWAASGARHGLRVIVHVGCDALLDAERLARHAAALGVDGVAAMAPRFVKCENADALAAYCASVELRRAVLLLPAGRRCHEPSQLVRAALARIPTFAGMKYSAADMWEYGECCDADADGRLAFLPGFEAQTLAHLPYHPRDAYGAISLSFSVIAPLHRDVADAFYGQRGAEAHALQATSRGFFRAVTPLGWTQAVKLALVDRGVLDSPLSARRRGTAGRTARSGAGTSRTRAGILAGCRGLKSRVRLRCRCSNNRGAVPAPRRGADWFHDGAG